MINEAPLDDKTLIEAFNWKVADPPKEKTPAFYPWVKEDDLKKEESGIPFLSKESRKGLSEKLSPDRPLCGDKEAFEDFGKPLVIRRPAKLSPEATEGLVNLIATSKMLQAPLDSIHFKPEGGDLAANLEAYRALREDLINYTLIRITNQEVHARGVLAEGDAEFADFLDASNAPVELQRERTRAAKAEIHEGNSKRLIALRDYKTELDESEELTHFVNELITISKIVSEATKGAGEYFQEAAVTQVRALALKACSDRLVSGYLGKDSSSHDVNWEGELGGQMFLDGILEHPSEQANDSETHYAIGLVKMLRDYNKAEESHDAVKETEFVPESTAILLKKILRVQKNSRLDTMAQKETDEFEGFDLVSTIPEDGLHFRFIPSNETKLGIERPDPISGEITALDRDSLYLNITAGYATTELPHNIMRKDPEFTNKFGAEASKMLQGKGSDKYSSLLKIYATIDANLHGLLASRGADIQSDLSNSENMLRLFCLQMGQRAELAVDKDADLRVDAPVFSYNTASHVHDGLDQQGVFGDAMRYLYEKSDVLLNGKGLMSEQAKLELSYAYANALVELANCDKAGIITMPRIIGKGEKYAKNDLMARPVPLK